jgi:hypothetical protein
MPGLAAVAAVTPDNTPHGYNLTFAVPLVLFAVVAVALYLLFSRPHRRIPARRGVLPAGRLAAPDADAARAAAVAGGLAVAAGGGAAESHLEPAGHVYATPDAADAGGAGGAGEGEADEAGGDEARADEARADEAGAGQAGRDADAGRSPEARAPDGSGPAPADQAEDGQ